jgi:hypothetical protein
VFCIYVAFVFEEILKRESVTAFSVVVRRALAAGFSSGAWDGADWARWKLINCEPRIEMQAS